MNGQGKGDWWGRNWKWFAPVAGLGALVVLLGFIALIMSFVFGMMKSSDAYKDAVAQAKAHPSVQEALGIPIEVGLLVTGNIHISGSSGEANLAIPISGPNARATIYAAASKSAGKWSFSTLDVQIKESEQRINLLERADHQTGQTNPTDS